ncbi:MAG: methyltransferase domain-containing protein [Chloroflexi bacterium]|nr:MAG: methyltransferase domain-containing protein [Chloroflexota bacterium]
MAPGSRSALCPTHPATRMGNCLPTASMNWSFVSILQVYPSYRPNKMMAFIQRVLTGFLRIFFDLLYHQMAWTYDLVAWLVSLGRWNSWVLSVTDDLPGPRILELGHGPGHLQTTLARQGKSCVGLDLSRQMGRMAKKRLEKENLIQSLVTGMGQKLPFENNSYNQVVATFPTEYIFQTDTLNEIHRVLKPGGAFVALPVAWITGGNLLDRAAALLFKITGQAMEIQDHQIVQAFQAAGFETHIERRQLTTSLLLIIHAQKS